VSAHNNASSRTPAAAGLSVVLVTYNSGYALDAALASVSDRLPAAEIIIVDNGSTDDTIAIAERRGVRRVLSGHGNVGYGAAVNLGIKAVTHPIILVINPDVVVQAVDQTELGTVRQSRPFGLVCCVSRSHGRSNAPIKVAWRWKRELASALFMWFLKPRRFNPRRRAPRRGQPGWVSGSSFLVDRKEWDLVGGFDEAIFLYYEDFDLSRRYLASGLPMRATDAIEVDHVRNESERGTGLELVQSWALRSLIETTATWEGDWAALRAARTALCALAAIDRLARIAEGLPFLGSLARRKGASVRAVRHYLIAVHPPSAQAAPYAASNRAFGRARDVVSGVRAPAQ
jgi:N-acetylglucosaminyl-diphospho-decaprenol L-rhamnosyltransferase